MPTQPTTVNVLPGARVFVMPLPCNPDGPRPTWLLADEDAFLHRLREHPQYVSCEGPAGAAYALTFDRRPVPHSAMETDDHITGFIVAQALAVGFVETH